MSGIKLKVKKSLPLLNILTALTGCLTAWFETNRITYLKVKSRNLNNIPAVIALICEAAMGTVR